jgi:carbon monoxide dehydrogenase subunit G
MKFTNQFSVAVPIEQVWDVLLDVRRVAGYLPGANVDPPSGDADGFSGSMKIKLGPVVTEYGGTVDVVRADAAEHVAVLDIEAREVGGQGTARATITNRLSATAEGTLVVVESEVDVTGRQAQFGHGILERVADRMLADFAKRFEAELAGGAPAPPSTDEQILDVGAAVMRSTITRIVVGVAAVGVAGVVAWRVLRGRR